MADNNSLGNPNANGGLTGASLGAAFKVDDSSLKSLHTTWRMLIQDVKDFNSALKQTNTAGAGLGGRGGGGGGFGHGGGSGRSSNLPALPSGFNSHITSSTGGSGGSGGNGGGGGGGGGGFSANAAAGAVGAGLLSLGSSSNVGQWVEGSQIYRNAAFGGGTATSARQSLFGGGGGASQGLNFGGFQGTQAVVNTLSTAYGPAVGGSPQGKQALRNTGMVSNLTGNPTGAANVIAQFNSPQTYYKAMALGISTTDLQSNPQKFAADVLKKIYKGKMPTQSDLNKDVQSGRNLAVDLGNLGFNSDTVNFIEEYAYAQAKSTAAGKGAINLNPTGPGGSAPQTAANKAAGINTNAYSAYQSNQSVQAGISQSVGAKTPLAGYYQGLATAGAGLIQALQGFLGSVAGAAAITGVAMNGVGSLLKSVGGGALGGSLFGGSGGGGGGGGGGLFGRFEGGVAQGAGLAAFAGLRGKFSGMFSGGGATAEGAAGGSDLLAAGSDGAYLGSIGADGSLAGAGGLTAAGTAGVVGAGALALAAVPYAVSKVTGAKKTGDKIKAWAAGIPSEAKKGFYEQFEDYYSKGPGKPSHAGGGNANVSSAASSGSSLLGKSSGRKGTGGAPAKSSLRVVRPLGAAPVTQAYGHNGHPGTDYGAPCGTPILAAEDGVVLLAGPAQGFGNWIVLQHPDGYYTVYGHMYDNGVLVHAGQKVTAGERIGLVGSNGDSTGCHLHLEVHNGWPGTRQDPEAWLVGHGAASVSGTAAPADSSASDNTSSSKSNSASSAPGAINGASAGNYGSVEEVDALSAGLSGGMGAVVGQSAGSNSSSNTTNSDGSSSSSTPPSATLAGGGASVPSTVSGNVKLAQTMAAARGWTGNEWSALYKLWEQESGFNATIANSKSGAYGIAQALPADKYATAGADWRTNPATQIKWGLDYIKGRYGDPLGAWAHEVADNWYREGTVNAKEGLAYLHGGEMVVNARQADQYRSAIRQQQTTSANNSMGGSHVGTGTTGGATVNVYLTAPVTFAGGAQDASRFVDQAVRTMQTDTRLKNLMRDAAGMSN